MASISAKVKDRLITSLKRFQPILSSAKARDVNESDTVTIVTDILAEVFGFDKYSEITSEYVIRGTFVDLAIKIEGTLETLVEVKAIGLELKDAFVKQAVDYAANQGVEWVILSNGALWQVYRVYFTKPIYQELVLELDLLSVNHKNSEDLDRLHMLTREGWGKSLLGEYHAQRQVLNRYYIGSMVLTETVLEVIRRELRRVSPDIKVDVEQIKEVLMQEVLKREVVEGERAEEARKKIARASNRFLRKQSREKAKDTNGDDTDDEALESTEPPPNE